MDRIPLEIEETAPVRAVTRWDAGAPIEWIAVSDLAQGALSQAEMVVHSRAMANLMLSVRRFAPTRANVLIEGESGTGKELVARAIHSLGPNPSGPFIVFNCSNLLDSLAESQLFGHVRGAFTDAREEALGYFRAADGGTLFLDEIGELPLKLQPKLLRAVENWEIQPVGSARSHHVNVRLLTATNRNLREMIDKGDFRSDLYYRLAVANVEIPPLRMRRDAIAALVANFLVARGKLLGRDIQYISRAALECLVSYDWPGNVRQLAHAVESAIISTDSDRIDVAELPGFVGQHRDQLPAEPGPSASELRSPSVDRFDMADRQLSLSDLTRLAVVRSLEASKGNRKRAAELLGISRPRLYRLLATFKLTSVANKRRLSAA